MPYPVPKLGILLLVALATFGVAVPTLFAAPCACALQQIEAQKLLAVCCAMQVATHHCESNSSKNDCCSGNGPCNCPGCKCAIHAPGATTDPALVELPDPLTQFLSLANLADIFATSAEQNSLAAHSEQTLTRSLPVPLRALYCVWII